MRLIDADKIEYTSIAHVASYPVAPSPCDTVMRAEINAMPTIDAVPVRHGKWVFEWETKDTRMLRCSECRMVFNVGKGRDGKYCPNCGAKMDAERIEE